MSLWQALQDGRTPLDSAFPSRTSTARFDNGEESVHLCVCVCVCVCVFLFVCVGVCKCSLELTETACRAARAQGRAIPRFESSISLTLPPTLPSHIMFSSLSADDPEVPPDDFSSAFRFLSPSQSILNICSSLCNQFAAKERGAKLELEDASLMVPLTSTVNGGLSAALKAAREAPDTTAKQQPGSDAPPAHEPAVGDEKKIDVFGKQGVIDSVSALSLSPSVSLCLPLSLSFSLSLSLSVSLTLTLTLSLYCFLTGGQRSGGGTCGRKPVGCGSSRRRPCAVAHRSRRPGRPQRHPARRPGQPSDNFTVSPVCFPRSPFSAFLCLLSLGLLFCSLPGFVVGCCISRHCPW
jgi:hypothetical protein